MHRGCQQEGISVPIHVGNVGNGGNLGGRDKHLAGKAWSGLAFRSIPTSAFGHCL